MSGNLDYINNDFGRTWVASHISAKRGVHIPLLYIDLNEGNIYDSIVFSQIMYWHEPSTETGQTRLQRHRDGHLWLTKNHADWYKECRVNRATVRKCLERIKKRGLIHYEIGGAVGNPTPFIRVNWNQFEKLVTALLSGKTPDYTLSQQDTPLSSEDTPPLLQQDTPLLPQVISNTDTTSDTTTTQDKEQIDAKASIDATANAASVVNETATSQSEPVQHSDSVVMKDEDRGSDAEQSQADITTPAVALEQTTPAAPAEEKKEKGKKAKKDKPADPDAPAIAALINAWKIESKVIDPAAFGKKVYRDCAREMIALGITPEHVKGCTADLKAEDYWSGRALPFTTVAQNVVAWAEENIVSSNPDGLPSYSVEPCDEYPDGLPYGISPDDPQAAIYRYDRNAPDDPSVLELLNSIGSEDRDAYAKYRIPDPTAPVQHQATQPKS